MNRTQRALLVVASLILLTIVFNRLNDGYHHERLPTLEFLSAVGLLYLAARRG